MPIDFNKETEYLGSETNMFVVYIMFLGQGADGRNIYQMLLSDSPDDVWGEQWGEKPACLCRDLAINESMYSFIKEFKTDISLTLGQDNCCGSLQDMKDGCFAMAYENIDGYEEYPEPLRLVFKYGEPVEEVEDKLRKRDIQTYFV